MGKSLVIKGSNFASTSIKKVTLSPIPVFVEEEITGSFVWTNGKGVQMTGLEAPSSYYRVCAFVDVSRYYKIRIAQPMYRVGPIKPDYPAIVFYDQNGTVITGIQYHMSDIEGYPSTEMWEYILPEGTKYIRSNYFMESYEEQWPDGHFIPFKCIGYVAVE